MCATVTPGISMYIQNIDKELVVVIFNDISIIQYVEPDLDGIIPPYRVISLRTDCSQFSVRYICSCIEGILIPHEPVVASWTTGGLS